MTDDKPCTRAFRKADDPDPEHEQPETFVPAAPHPSYALPHDTAPDENWFAVRPSPPLSREEFGAKRAARKSGPHKNMKR